MKIVNLLNELYQVIDPNDGHVYYQGMYSDCECYIRYIAETFYLD